MGDTAEKTTIEDDTLETEIAEDEDITQLSDEPSEGEETAEEIEIVREGSQPKSKSLGGSSRVRDRISKLNAKVETATDTASAANVELALTKEKLKLVELRNSQLEQDKTQPSAPDPDDFDEGKDDPKFKKKQGEYIQSIVQPEVVRQVAEANTQNANTQKINSQAKNLEGKQFEHYERVNDLKVKNYIEREDAAIDILGKNTFDVIVRSYDNSESVLYYLGTPANKKEAENLASLIESDLVLGISEMGALRKELIVKPKSKIAPDPDEELKGEKTPDLSANDRKLDKLREQAAKTGDMKP